MKKSKTRHQSSRPTQTTATVLMTIIRLETTFGLFSFVTGAGSVGEGGGGLEYRFSLRLFLEDLEVVEVEESVDDTDRLVFRRSRILESDSLHIRRSTAFLFKQTGASTSDVTG